ncbi:3-hydroxyacyl-CoA dehydrogenase NAD-binding domain-containing protein [Nocardia sp. NBC_00565]|uniref:3-hydroxyacyl-CoA dehydrogenase NAD-binding domain-containing protein n=1 Tax=Nocardia sp. NBC_00565 TaxID=2975993 RepID=UPI002E81A4A5|nr:3-hydroxyacyl-CoA dehydrogenase NAD-binding domain-containing protein [Nocardia sp. NBC_00565]WUC05580.1 3-hydroxyacyl-CoA dehydrogenase NAD-binding domain-containing protein [Nocardia sp. NBC_00565]
MSENIIRWESGGDGIVVLTIDDPNQSANTMNQAYIDSMGATVDRLEAERDSITGVVLTSAKKTFFAGGDLNDLLAVTDEQAAEFFATTEKIKADLRRLEKLSKPVVAAVNGAALGGGLEIALACHHRVALNAKGTQIGLPEVGLGLLPGGGGLTRTVRMFGIQQALTAVLLQGQRYNPARALELGLVDELAETSAELLVKATDYIKANPEAGQPWDVKGYKIPAGTPATPSFAANLPALPATVRKQIKGANLPAPVAILSAAVEGSQVDFDTASTIESRYLTELVTGQVAKNMIQAFFFDMQQINSGGSRPAGYPVHKVEKVVVLGAGMMGAGIAHVCAKAGIEVILRDVSLEAAERGKNYSVKLVDKAIAKATMTREVGEELLAKITATADVELAAGADLVIEAVFEEPGLKAKVFAEIEPVVAADAVLGSNTSTLPITGLAESVTRPADFIGLHFFSPVDKMNLLEIIVGERTDDATLAKAMDFAQQIRKTPIVANDSRGFFTSRVIGKFLDEAIAMVGEGIAPASIEQAGLQAGYPAPPLQLNDELTLTLPRKIREETKAAEITAGKQWPGHGSEAVVDRLIDEFDRKGRSTGGGFYDYVDGRRTGLWAGLAEHFTKPGNEIPFEDMKERMLFAEAIDTVKCFDEGVLRSVADANIGSILGIGFPAWTGGAIQYINGYSGGVAGFVARANELADKYGSRFVPPDSLVAKAAAGETFE